MKNGKGKTAVFVTITLLSAADIQECVLIRRQNHWWAGQHLLTRVGEPIWVG